MTHKQDHPAAPPAQKRIKLHHVHPPLTEAAHAGGDNSDGGSDSSSSSSAMPHVRPLGNALGLPSAQTSGVRTRGLGRLAGCSDELLLETLLPRIARAYACACALDSRAAAANVGDDDEDDSSGSAKAAAMAVCLGKLAQASSVLNTFVSHDALWRDLFLSACGGRPGRARIHRWLGSWRATYIGQFVLAGNDDRIALALLAPRRQRRRGGRCLDEQRAQDPPPHVLYSDALFHPYHMASLQFDTLFFPWIRQRSVHDQAQRAHGHAMPAWTRAQQRRMHYNPIPRVDPPSPSASAGAGDRSAAADAHAAARSFFEAHCKRNWPAIIGARGTSHWPCRAWSLDELVRRFGGDGDSQQQQGATMFAAEAFECSLSAYRDYARSCAAFDARHAVQRAGSSGADVGDADKHEYEGAGRDTATEQGRGSAGAGPGGRVSAWLDAQAVADESPAYLFDATFADGERASKEWRVPEWLRVIPPGCARTVEPGAPSSSGGGSTLHEQDETDERRETMADLFRLFGDKRPDYRWIIAGPRRSGSGWHKDPNMTSAWNAVMRGSKLWLMLPPDTCPPGVYVSPDEAEVTAPLSNAEWLLGFYDEAKRKHGPHSIGGDGKLLEGVCVEGETMYVPSGWWHFVINLQECVALTQNFVSICELPNVLRFLRDKPDQISGFKGCDEDDDQDDAEECSGGVGHKAASSPTARLYDEFCNQLRKFDACILQHALQYIAPAEHTATYGPSSAPEPFARKAAGASTRGKATTASTGQGLPLSFALGAQLDESELGDVPW